MSGQGFNLTEEHINRLKNKYPDKEYMPHQGAAGWLQGLGIISKEDIGIQVLLGPFGVNWASSSNKQQRLKPEPSAVYLAGLAGIARAKQIKVSIGLPPFGRDLSLFIGCTSVLNKIIEHGINASPHSKGILIISPDIGIRSLYCDFLIKREPLDAAFPGSRMLPNGKIEPLGKSVNKIYSGVCFFLPHRRELPRAISIKPDFIILDFRYSKLNSKVRDLVKWVSAIRPITGILALYTIGDRTSRDALKNDNYRDFPLDHIGIQTFRNSIPGHLDGAGSSIDIKLSEAQDALARKHIVKDITVSPKLKEILRNLIKLFDEYREDNHPEINRLRWLFSVYTHMPVPLIWYENTARRLGRWLPRNVIKRIGTNTRDIGKLAPVLQTFRTQFTLLNNLYEKENPKADEIRKLILSLSNKLTAKNRLLILARDDIAEGALSSWLSLSEFLGKEWLSNNVDIVSCRKFVQYANRRYTFFITAGAIHSQYRWILGARLGSELFFLLYPHEISAIQKQIEQFYNPEYLNLRAERRKTIVDNLTNSSSSKNTKETIHYPTLDLTIPKIEDDGKPKKEFKSRVKSFDDLLKIFENEQEDIKKDKEEGVAQIDEIATGRIEGNEPEYSEDEVKQFANDQDGVVCYEVALNSKERGSGLIWIGEAACVEYIRPDNSSELGRSSPKELLPGDLLLIVDESQQSSIFDKLIEIADSNPNLQYLATYRHVWRKAISLLADKFLKADGKIDYDGMFHTLKKEGMMIQTVQAIQNWVNDIIIGPEDISSIIAVGKVSGIVELANKSKEFDKNFEEIRTLHRTIGRRVARSIRKTFQIVAADDTVEIDDRLHDRLGVPLNEIINAIEIAEVQNVTLRRDGIIPDLIGKFIKREAK